MRCPFCTYQFEETDAHGCKGCTMARTCHMIRCPNCGYEIPAEPKLIKAIRAWRQKNATGRKR